MQTYDRFPSATYEQAINRLVYLEVADRHSSEQLELAVQIVADMFWLSDAKVRVDVQRAVRKLGGNAPLPVRRRRSVQHFGGAL